MSSTARAAEASLRSARSLGKRLMWTLGYDVRRLHAPQWADFSADQHALYAEVRPFTQTSPERVVTLADAV
jgi:hypothetical protein